MWVADMDFKAAPCIQAALQKRLDAGTFGYTAMAPGFRSAVAGWWQHRHQLTLDPASIFFVGGIVPALSSIVRSLTNVCEKVLVQTPVYNHFFTSIEENGRQPLACDLLYDQQTHSYSIDFDALEKSLADPAVTLMIVCNPHNPSGNLWTRDELARIGELCERHHVQVVSDEIHCDVTAPGVRHVPFVSASDSCRRISLTCCSPSKAFNLAGLQSSYVFSDNALLRARVSRGFARDNISEPNAFALTALIAAYGEGEGWLDALCCYVHKNKEILSRMLGESGTGLVPVASDATYLSWIDCSSCVQDSGELCRHLRRTTGLVLNAGSSYGDAGRQFVRINLGTTHDNVRAGAQRLIEGVRSYKGC